MILLYYTLPLLCVALFLYLFPLLPAVVTFFLHRPAIPLRCLVASAVVVVVVPCLPACLHTCLAGVEEFHDLTCLH